MAHTDSVLPINHQLQDIVANIPSPAATRKRRRSFQWIPENHLKFVNALNRSGGIDGAKPCQILELMKNVPGLTREILASHLQKYRAFKNKKEHKRVNKFAKMEELMVMQHQPNPAALSNNSQHASNIVPGTSNFVPDYPLQPYSAQEGDQEEYIFGALSPLQESYPMPPSAYPTNHESYVLQPQFLPTPTQPTLTQLDYGASIPHQEIQNMCFPTHQLNYDDFVQSLFASNSNQEIDGNLSFPTHQLDYDEIVESPFASSPTNIW